ncbi:MAG: J domain-containing protein [SAR324 cluster bacterium]|nr:J domain-containing protein [SAR324 cluster bacterium]
MYRDEYGNLVFEKIIVQQKTTSHGGDEDAIDDPYTILGISNTATNEEIKRAYITLIKEYHPDKVASLGTKLRDLAEKEAKRINAAYQKIIGK